MGSIVFAELLDDELENFLCSDGIQLSADASCCKCIMKLNSNHHVSPIIKTIIS